MDWHGFSLLDLEALTSPKILERGREYLNEGHLRHTCKVENVLAGVFIGTNGNYKARLWIQDSEFMWECSCPFPEFCKHLAALAMAWVERKEDFFDLQPLAEELVNDIPKLQKTCMELIRRDPGNLMDLVLFGDPRVCAGPNFITSRGIINLMRNIFRNIRLTPADMEGFSERIARVGNLITGLIEKGDPEALTALGELLESFAVSYKEYQNEFLLESFKHLLSAVDKVPLSFAPDAAQSFLESVLSIYFDPGLWELSIPIRGVLSKYLEYNIAFLEVFLKAKSEDEENVIALAAVYEILDIASKNISFVTEQADNITRKLCATSKGYLWLIDRLMESDPEKAYKLARKGLTAGFESAGPFRDRLVTAHLKRNEPKQAAALSFIQFKEEPNFEEYLKLKTILAKHPNDFIVYLKQIHEFLLNSNREKLLIRIFIDREDTVSIITYLPRITAEPSLLLPVAELLSVKILAQFKEIYPVIINALLLEDSLPNAKAAVPLMLAYKKLCFQMEDLKGWEILKEELTQQYKTGLFLSKKILSILNH